MFDPVEAMHSSAPTLHPQMAAYEGLPQPVATVNNVFAHNNWSKGDITAGFSAADRIFEHTFNAQLMHQGYIEPHACVVHIDDTGRAQVWANNKGPFMLREQLAAVWDVPTEQIRVNPTSIGGDFGGKGSFMDVPLCYHLARHSGRPVKMVMDYIQELMAGNPRHPAIITLKTGVTRDGRILAHQVRVVFNSGAYGAFKPRVYIRGADHSGGPYRIPHVQIDSYMVYTNNVPCGHMRAPGKPQVAFAVESHMDMMARELGLDPYEFRLQNILQDGDANPVGEKLHHIRAEETLRKAAEAMGWDHADKPGQCGAWPGDSRPAPGRRAIHGVGYHRRQRPGEPVHVPVGYGHGRADGHAANCRRDAHAASAAGASGDARHRCSALRVRAGWHARHLYVGTGSLWRGQRPAR